jgi:hypothetical protein
VQSGDFFTTDEQNQIAKSIAAAEASSDLNFSLYVGELEEGRKDANKLHKRLENSSATVLVCVDLQNHAIEIVTGSYASSTVDNQACRLAAVSMANAFAINDFPVPPLASSNSTSISESISIIALDNEGSL